MPDTSVQIQKQLTMSSDLLVIPECFAQLLPAGHVIGTPYPLFKKIEVEVGDEMKAKFAGVRDESKVSKGKQNGVATPAGNVAEIELQIKEQGDIVRKAKGDKVDKSIIDAEVKKLLALKQQLVVAQGAAKPETNGN